MFHNLFLAGTSGKATPRRQVCTHTHTPEQLRAGGVDRLLLSLAPTSPGLESPGYGLQILSLEQYTEEDALGSPAPHRHFPIALRLDSDQQEATS